MKFYSLILSCLTFLLMATPAYAGRLLSWRFESNQNRLVFSTDERVQPSAQLIANPTRLVIDLPGTILGQPTINQSYGGLITSVRIGQFDSNTTRLVIEVAQGYTLDPQQIKIQGISPTQWSVNIPQPRLTGSGDTIPNSNDSSTQSAPPRQTLNQASNNFNPNSPLQISPGGIIIGIPGNVNNKINVNRSSDRRQIEFELEGVTIPNNLIQSWDLNQYGVKTIKVSQKGGSPARALVTMDVDSQSPDWLGSFSRMGGLVIWPVGGMSRVQSLSPSSSNSNITPTPSNANNNPTSSSSQKAIIESMEIINNQLVIRGNQALRGEGSRGAGNSYQIRFNNTDLANNFRNPQLFSNSPISRLRIWQPDDQTVVLLVEPARGITIEGLSQNSPSVLSLALSNITGSSNDPFNNSGAIPNLPPNSSPLPINVPPPRRPSPPPTTNNNPPRSRTLVVIDPGHGGTDSGAIGIGGLREKDVILPISEKVAQILEQQGIQVKMTRNTDVFISLQGRTALANSLNADLFVSIHANSAGANKPQVSGLETYYFQSGRNLATVIHRNILQRININDRRVRQARFYVLRTANMPSVLVETGFLTGTDDASRLPNPNYQQQMAQGIAAGILEYIRTNRL
ncbi:MAG: N-acetylmuramoyl-L-alanine amidase [Cyanobacterium sp. T60_A2020_053]|nr:N-acetylmuramoyl-L-alanine amidase [Cyanobacterium sp. T60_A2020_053]